MADLSLQDPNSESNEAHGTSDETSEEAESNSQPKARKVSYCLEKQSPVSRSEEKRCYSYNNLDENNQGVDVSNEYIDFTTFYLTSLEELATSDYIRNRQLAAQRIVACLQQAGSRQDELHSIISIICKLSEDEESLVRSELVQHIPAIAMHCHNHPDLNLVITQQLVPYTVKLLGDNLDYNQIEMRKLAQSTLLELMKNNLIGHLQLSEWICPLIVQLATNESNLEKPEDIIVMFRMIPLVPRDITIKYFLEPFVTLCADEAYGIRTLCALKFGIFCNIAGREITESSLLPAFLNLCSDSLWDVKKACAGVFVDVALVVSSKTRNEVLLHVFIDLLNDTSHYVQFAAYQSLGGFIYSFSDPSKTGCTYEQGKLKVVDLDKETRCSDISHNCVPFRRRNRQTAEKTKEKIDVPDTWHSRCYTAASDNFSTSVSFDQCKMDGDTHSGIVVSSKDGRVFLHVDNENHFNNFQFWRTPLPEIELDVDIDKGNATNILIRAKVSGNETSPACASEIKLSIASENNRETNEGDPAKSNVSKLQVQTACINTIYPQTDNLVTLEDIDVMNRFKEAILTFKDDDLVEVAESVNTTTISDFTKGRTSESPNSWKIVTPYDQDIVPPELLFRFISVANQPFPMTDVIKHTDDERVGYCAYSFPAVVFTLGRKYWPCIHLTCMTLASHMKWTVRKTIASYLHVLATILGDEITVEDLLPIFLELMKDINEVRISLLMHISEFLQHLWPIHNERDRVLPLIKNFSRLDNDTNWRFRCVVAERLPATLELFNGWDIYDNFLPVALFLIQDQVSAVRHAAVEFLADIVKHMFEEDEIELERKVVALFKELVDLYQQAHTWRHRQTYVMICEKLAMKRALPMNRFLNEFFPHLISLAWDEVPNIRIAVARCIALTILPDFLPCIQENVLNKELLLKAMHSLQGDMDKDVSHFMQFCAQTYCKKTYDCELFCCNKRYSAASSLHEHGKNYHEPVFYTNKKHKISDPVEIYGPNNLQAEPNTESPITYSITNPDSLSSSSIRFEDPFPETPVESVCEMISTINKSLTSSILDCKDINITTAEIRDKLSPL